MIVPLAQGKSQKTISKNIQTELKAHPSMRPKQAAAIAYSEARQSKDTESARSHDLNGYMDVSGSNISRVGVFPYSGAQIAAELEGDRIYMVYRPEESLSDLETIESFKLLPFTDEHAMLGAEDGTIPAEQKGVHGITSSNVYYEAPYLKADIRVFSEHLKDLISKGKTELSIGYRCLYEQKAGEYDGQKYDFIQRELRGNHLALVDEGRSGPDVAVLDSFTFVCDTMGMIHPDLPKPDSMEKREMEKIDGSEMYQEDEMSLEECGKMVKELMAKVEKMMSAEKAEAEMMDEEPEIKKELSKEAAAEGDAKDAEADPDDFVSRANIEDSDEDPQYEASKMKEAEARDEDEEKKDGDKSKGMDSQLKSIMREISRRDTLASQLSNHIGTFDHSQKTVQEVAQYGVKKLGLSCRKGHEESVLSGYLAASKGNRPVIAAQDSGLKASGIDAYLRGVK